MLKCLLLRFCLSVLNLSTIVPNLSAKRRGAHKINNGISSVINFNYSIRAEVRMLVLEHVSQLVAEAFCAAYKLVEIYQVKRAIYILPSPFGR